MPRKHQFSKSFLAASLLVPTSLLSSLVTGKVPGSHQVCGMSRHGRKRVFARRLGCSKIQAEPHRVIHIGSFLVIKGKDGIPCTFLWVTRSLEEQLSSRSLYSAIIPKCSNNGNPWQFWIPTLTINGLL